MTDDYLFDPSSAPDPDVVRLERMLGRLRSTPPAPRLPQVVRGPARLSYRFVPFALAIAASVLLMVGFAWKDARPASFAVSTVSGTPRIAGVAISGAGRLAAGQTLSTAGDARALIEVGDIGSVMVEGDSRVRLVDTRAGRHRLALDHGTLHAVISAPPGQFVVDTPSATATDLGCVYTLRVTPDGSSVLSVALGWVAFEDRGRESFVPAGASARTSHAHGPGTPRFDDAEAAFREALDVVDVERGAAHADALRIVLTTARSRDAMTLWHLLSRVTSDERPAVLDALAPLVASPPPVSREATLALDHAALDQWWDALGLADTTWWRGWRAPAIW